MIDLNALAKEHFDKPLNKLTAAQIGLLSALVTEQASSGGAPKEVKCSRTEQEVKTNPKGESYQPVTYRFGRKHFTTVVGGALDAKMQSIPAEFWD